MFSKTLFVAVIALAVSGLGEAAVAQTAGVPATGQPEAEAKKPQKIYELRIYQTNPEKLADLHARFKNHTLKLFEKHDMENVIYWTLAEDFNDEKKDDTLIYILAHKSKEAADASWAAFRADPEWQAIVAKSEENGKLLAKTPVSTFMNPTDFHPGEWEPNAKSDKPARLFEMRQYGGGADNHAGRFRDWEAELFRTSGIETLGFFTTADNSTFVYYLGHKDRPTADANWAKFFTGFRGRGGAGGGRRRGGQDQPPQVREEVASAQGVAQAATQDAGQAAAQDGGLGRGAGAEGQGRRAGRGRGGAGNVSRWLVPTDYSPRK